MIKSLCVFSGSRMGADPSYAEAAQRLGELVALRGWELVYGGGNIGLMGVTARAVLARGGRVTGVVPEYIHARVEQVELTELIVTETMHQRKARMYELADSFAALPGGIGTLEELAEIIAWSGLGFHSKPVALLNTRGFYDQLLSFLDRAVGEDFFHESHRQNILVATTPEELLDQVSRYRHRALDKWRDKSLK